MTAMNETLGLALAAAAGGVLGVFFFAGLWWTVRRCLISRQPAVWILCSMLLRTGVAVGGFFFVSCGQWQRLAACLAGFLMARVMVSRLTRPMRPTQLPPVQQGRPAQEMRHAP